MVKTYLENLKEEYLLQEQKIEKQVHDLQLKLKENEEIQKMLDRNEDSNYELFTPREVNQENKFKILELRNQREDLIFRIKDEQEQREIYNRKIEELDLLIQNLSDSLLLEKKIKDEEQTEFFRIGILEIQENERQRISRELHDDTVQTLTSLVHKADLCSKLVDMDPIRCKLELASMTNLLHEVIRNMREMIFDLRPMSFDDMGLDVTIARAIDKLELEDSKKRIHFRVEGESYNLRSVVGITILRIIQEACSNALHHANASSIHVILSYEPKNIYIEISDNGDGFDTKNISSLKLENNSGFGLTMMKERIYLLSGSIEILSEPGIGTSIKVNVPIEEE